MDWSKITNNKKAIKHMKHIMALEEEVNELDPDAMVKFSLERLQQDYECADVTPIKYEKEIDDTLRELFFDASWMNEGDYADVIDEAIRSIGMTKRELSDQIEAGVENGFSVGRQLQIIRSIFI